MCNQVFLHVGSKMICPVCSNTQSQANCFVSWENSAKNYRTLIIRFWHYTYLLAITSGNLFVILKYNMTSYFDFICTFLSTKFSVLFQSAVFILFIACLTYLVSGVLASYQSAKQVDVTPKCLKSRSKKNLSESYNFSTSNKLIRRSCPSF